ncbi:glycine oxidase [Salsuginibacillus halophilus]|uniref:glycine oxidase n=1 Tax=Salsuginibacillus halophilus TaxID=517424 RepID=A0A2P8H807_9BACI|nr:glycine oxidase ThiO [Salsuginibacillus halophilus]PSL42334.1 glycine oxidase [Salsuginibacillus halophilus]
MEEHVTVIGGGIIGLAAAYECRRRGFSVTIIEAGEFGGQASGAAAGMLAPFSEIEEDPDDFFRLAFESLTLYEPWVSAVQQSSNTSFEYANTGSLHVVYHEADQLALETRQKWQGDFGVDARILDQSALQKLEPELSSEIIGAMHYPEESHVYTPDYVKALASACANEGVTMYAKAGEPRLTRTTEPYEIKLNNGTVIETEQIIVANGAWAKSWEETLGIRIPVHPIRGQICSYQPDTPLLSHIVFSPQGYFVPKANGTLVNGASEDLAGFSTEVTEKGINRLKNWGPHVLPALEEEPPVHTWAGIRPATQDGYPLIGEVPNLPGVQLAVGHYRNGILLSPVTAAVLADRIEAKSDRVPMTLFQPARFT